MPPSLLVQRPEMTRRLTEHERAPWTVAFWVGLGLAVIGIADAAFLWYPAELGEAAWRVTTIRATIDALPLATIGLASMLVAGIFRQGYRALSVVTITAGVMFAAIIGMIVLFALSLLRVQSATDPLAPGMVDIVRSGLFAAVYLFLYGLFAVVGAREMLSSPDAP